MQSIYVIEFLFFVTSNNTSHILYLCHKPKPYLWLRHQPYFVIHTHCGEMYIAFSNIAFLYIAFFVVHHERIKKF
uniref:Candidate secreted effector n=1 Tax=Meloidogyne incognita TaxID=6306 RepID=A0A914MC52_MELIC